MTVILPPLRVWSKTLENRCVPDEIPVYWKAHDVITFLADTGMYDPTLSQGLDDAEKERVLQFKSHYYKKRFIVSRSLLKNILRHINGTGNRDEIVLSRERERILVNGWPDMHICLSYSGSSIAVSVAKRKIGVDIEGVRPVDIKKIRSSPLFEGSKCRNKKEESLQALHIWTLVEAWAKLRDSNPYQFLNSSSLLYDASFVSYCVDRRLILSLASDTGNLDHAMFWIEPQTFSSRAKNENLPGHRGR